MIASSYEAFAIVVLIVNAIAILLIIVLQQVHMRRYEKFRTEVGVICADFQDSLDDINRRMVAAGYPPGRVLPRDPPR